MKSKVRHRFKDFILRNIKETIQEQEYLDVGFIGQEGSLKISAHRFVLSGLSPLLHKAFLSSGDEEETCVIFPDIPHMTIAQFLSLAYGILTPDVIEPDDRREILTLCHLLQMDTVAVLADGNAPATVNVTGDFGDDVPVIPIKEEDDDEEETAEDDEEDITEKEIPESLPTSSILQPPVLFQCPVCSRTFPTEEDLDEHGETHNDLPPQEDKPMEADDETEEVFAVKSKILLRESKLGKASRALKEKARLDCSICGKAFSRRDILTDHIKRHLGSKVKCEFCTKEFRTKNDLYKHKQRMHAKEAGLRSGYVGSCNICGRKFTDMGKSYQDHMNLHAGIKNYECQICSEKFSTQVALADHRFNHTEGGTHRCKICLKEFRRIQNIRNHIAKFHDLKTDDDVRANIEKLFLSGVDKMILQGRGAAQDHKGNTQ